MAVAILAFAAFLLGGSLGAVVMAMACAAGDADRKAGLK